MVTCKILQHTPEKTDIVNVSILMSLMSNEINVTFLILGSPRDEGGG